jgi:hypothetical protein
MRTIISLMAEYRQKQLEARGAPPARVQQMREMFACLDNGLSAVPVAGFDDELQEVMTSGDFTHALQTFVQRQMLPAYEAKRFNFERFMWQRTVPNFMQVDDYQKRSFGDDLEMVGEKGQARPGSDEDATQRRYRVYRWEKQYDYSMEALVNDDMGYFQNKAAEMGIDARRTLEKHVNNWLFNAVTLARLLALGALYWQPGRLSTARISEMRMGFNQRLDARGNPIAASLRYIVIHSGLVDTAATIQNSTLVPELATNAQNVVKGTFEVIEDPHLAGVAPNLPWMGLTDWRANNIKAFVLARRNGVPGPFIIRKRSDQEQVTSLLGAGTQMAPIWGDFDSGDIVLKVHDEWGTYVDAGALGTANGNLYDERGAFYMQGTAP